MESISCGTPVISKPIGIIPEILDHANTAFIMKNDNDALADGIRWQRSLTGSAKENLRNTLRQKALEKFNPKNVASEYALLYDTLLST
jgi:glycosyltransferase involved in cell wall biosynthesis